MDNKNFSTELFKNNEIINTLSKDIDLLRTNLFVKSFDLKNVLKETKLFENVLGLNNDEIYENKDKLTKIISYLIVSQLLLYSKIQKTSNALKSINNATSIKEIKNCFQSISHEKKWKPIFDFDILGNYIETENEQKILDNIKIIINDIENILLNDIPNEIIGIIFHRLIPLDIRKIVAAYYTMIPTSILLSGLVINDSEMKVIDLSCGCGNLLTASYKRKREIIEQEREFNKEDHKRFIEEQIFGIDVMPFATMLAKINLSLQYPDVHVNKMNFGIEDSTILKPNDVIYPFIRNENRYKQKNKKLTEFIKYNSNEKTDISKKQKTVVNYDENNEDSIVLSKYDLVIINPPFTKSQNLSKIYDFSQDENEFFDLIEVDYKEILKDNHLREYKSLIDKQMGLHGYFMLLADRFLNDNGIMACVIPSSFLRVKSCLKIREYLSLKYNIDYIISRSDQSNFSENTAFGEILFVASKKNNYNENNKDCKYIKLSELPEEIDQIKSLIEDIKQNKESSLYTITSLSQKTMRVRKSNWFIPIALKNNDLKNIWRNIIDSDIITDYNNIINIKNNLFIGVSSISNNELDKYIIVDPIHIAKKDTWCYSHQINKDVYFFKNGDKKETFKVNLMNLRRGIRTNKYKQFFELDEINDYIIVNEFDDLKQMLSSYYNTDKIDIDRNELNVWKKTVNSRSSKLFHIRRFDITAPGTIHVGYYSPVELTPTGLTWSIKNVNEENSKILTLWHNSTFYLFQVYLNRKETRGGFMGIDSYHFDSYYILDLNKLTSDQKKQCLQLYDELKNKAFDSIFNQLKNHDENKVIIDEFFAKMLFPDMKDVKDFVINFQSLMIDELDALKKTMNENALKDDDNE